MIFIPKNSPTDAEYVQAFRDDDNQLIDRFMREQRGRFVGTIKKKYTIKIDGAYDEIYQEALVRMWEKINKDESFVLFGSLSNFFIGYGIKAAQEYMREHKHLIRQIRQQEEDREDGLIDEDSIDDNVDNSFKPFAVTPRQVWEDATWIDAVEKPYDEFVSRNHTPDECIDEWNRLADKFEKSTSRKSFVKEPKTDIRLDIVDKIVENMGEPCSPILIGVWWEKKSMATLAVELKKYADADSVKTQKYKCVKKLETIIKNNTEKFLAYEE